MIRWATLVKIVDCIIWLYAPLQRPSCFILFCSSTLQNGRLKQYHCLLVTLFNIQHHSLNTEQNETPVTVTYLPHYVTESQVSGPFQVLRSAVFRRKLLHLMLICTSGLCRLLFLISISSPFNTYSLFQVTSAFCLKRQKKLELISWKISPVISPIFQNPVTF